MARKSKILKPFKQVKKDAIPVMVNAAISGVSFLGAKAASNKLTPKITNEKMQKIVGPGKIIIGMAIEAFVDEPKIAAIGRGIAISGFDQSAQDFIPEATKEKIGLSGPEKPIDASADNSFDWEQAAREAEEEMFAQEEEAPVVEEEQPVNGTPAGDFAAKAAL